jgi:phosphoglycerate kinase
MIQLYFLFVIVSHRLYTASFPFLPKTTYQDEVTVTDDTRLRAIVPTTKFLLEKGANPILCSHFGRPKGEIIETGKNGRLNPVVKPLEQLLGTSIIKVNDCIGPEAEQAASKLTTGQVLLLENTRFHKGETKNDAELSKGLSKLADYFVMVRSFFDCNYESELYLCDF